ncbi:MAG: hypothetical protein AAF788_06545, partial [Pseudomonadota bacterium]
MPVLRVRSDEGTATPRLMNNSPAAETRLGVLSAIAAYVMWGLLPVYLIAMRSVGADEILVHRILWSVPFGALIIAARKQWPDIQAAFSDRRVMLALFGSSAIIAFNWLIYIYAVQSQQIFEASLGYYITPLIYVLVGV